MWTYRRESERERDKNHHTQTWKSCCLASNYITGVALVCVGLLGFNASLEFEK